MTPELMAMLRDERERLDAELKATPTYRRLEAVNAMLAAYADAPSKPDDKWDKVAADDMREPDPSDELKFEYVPNIYPVEPEPETAPPQSVDDQIVAAISAAGPQGHSSVDLLGLFRIGYDPMIKRLKALIEAGRIVRVNNGVNGTVYIAPPQQGNDTPSERIERTLSDAGDVGMKATALRAVSDLDQTSFKAMMDALIAEGAVKRAGDRYYRIVPLQPNGAQA